MAKKPTVYDVAERAGVSIATVSFAFTQPHRVRESTREAVEEAALALGYLPSASARGLAQGKTGAIGLFSFRDFGRTGAEASSPTAAPTDSEEENSPDTGRPIAAVFSDESNADFRLFPLYHDEVQRGVEMECRRRGYVLMVGRGGRGEGDDANILDIASRVDGLAVFPNTLPGGMLRRIAIRMPVVELSTPVEDNGLHRVSVQNVKGMKLLTEHLIHHHGFRAIAFVGPTGSPDKAHRYSGYVDAMGEAGLEIRTIPAPRRTDPALDIAKQIHTLTASGQLPQAIMCSADAEALLYVDALAQAGLDVPKRVAVTGFDGIAAGLVNRPTLTTVRQPMLSLGSAAAAILIDQVARPSASPVSRQFPVTLALRESCGCGS